MNPTFLGVIGPGFLNQVPTLGFRGLGFLRVQALGVWGLGFLLRVLSFEGGLCFFSRVCLGLKTFAGLKGLLGDLGV